MDWFEKTYKDCFIDIYKYIYILTSDLQTAEDLAQDTFMLLYDRQYKLSDHPNIKGWLYKTAKNKAWDFMKKQNRKKKLDIELSTRSLTEYYHIDVIPDNIYEQLAVFLNDKEIELIRLNKEYGFTIKEISKQNGINLTALKQQLYRAIKKARKFLNIAEGGSGNE